MLCMKKKYLSILKAKDKKNGTQKSNKLNDKQTFIVCFNHAPSTNRDTLKIYEKSLVVNKYLQVVEKI